MPDEAHRVPDGAAGFSWDHIVCATGSGGTLAGMNLGARLLGLSVRIWGVNVCDSAVYFQKKVLEIAQEFRDRWIAEWGGDPATASSLEIPLDEIRILDQYKGAAYARTYPEEVARIRDVARQDGLLLDPVYTGKAFHGLLEEAVRGRFGRDGERVLFVHTGGLFSLFSQYREELLGTAPEPAPGSEDG